MIAGTVCFAVLATGGTLIVVEILNPGADTSLASRQVTDVINTLIGLLAGFLAGRTDANAQERVRKEIETRQRQDPP